jgi:DNA-binding MarR family transcriptional regulator
MQERAAGAKESRPLVDDEPPPTQDRSRAEGRATDPVAEAIVDALRAFTTAMDRYIDVHGGTVGMHRTDLVALAHVMDASRRGAQMTPTELSSALNLSPPATSALLTRLEAVGHVRRTHASSDRRRVSIEMTNEAIGVGRQVFGPLAEAMRAAIAGSTRQEQDVVLRFLTDVLAATGRATDA